MQTGAVWMSQWALQHTATCIANRPPLPKVKESFTTTSLSLKGANLMQERRWCLTQRAAHDAMPPQHGEVATMLTNAACRGLC